MALVPLQPQLDIWFCWSWWQPNLDSAYAGEVPRTRSRTLEDRQPLLNSSRRNSWRLSPPCPVGRGSFRWRHASNLKSLNHALPYTYRDWYRIIQTMKWLKCWFKPEGVVGITQSQTVYKYLRFITISLQIQTELSALNQILNVRNDCWQSSAAQNVPSGQFRK